VLATTASSSRFRWVDDRIGDLCEVASRVSMTSMMVL
jgi:hypothetical protein